MYAGVSYNNYTYVSKVINTSIGKIFLEGSVHFDPN